MGGADVVVVDSLHTLPTTPFCFALPPANAPHAAAFTPYHYLFRCSTAPHTCLSCLPPLALPPSACACTFACRTTCPPPFTPCPHYHACLPATTLPAAHYLTQPAACSVNYPIGVCWTWNSGPLYSKCMEERTVLFYTACTLFHHLFVALHYSHVYVDIVIQRNNARALAWRRLALPSTPAAVRASCRLISLASA